jgi:hypothetical protein
MASYQYDGIKKRYHLPQPELEVNDKWMTKAKKDNPAESLIAKMKLTQARIAKNDQGASRTATLRRPYQLLILLLCRLYGRKSGRFFKSSWAPLIHEISTNGTILNWATILSDSMSLAINQIRKSAQVTGFYMSSYFMDAVCASNTFPALSWRWTPKCHPVHIYCHMLWERKYKVFYTEIISHFIIPLLKAVQGSPVPYM